MSAGTDINYDGVWLYNVKTLVFDQRNVRESSDTDVMFTEFTVAFESIVHLSVGNNAPNVGVGPIPASNLADKIIYLQKVFSHERKPFEYLVNGVSLFRIGNVASGAISNYAVPDSNNGPKVSFFKISHFASSAFRIQCEIKICVPTCGTDSDKVVSNRWTVAETVDEDWVTTREIHGRLRLRRALKSAHELRSLVVPGLGLMFKRISMNFVAEPNGLDFSYHITDKMMRGDAAPLPAIRWSGTHTETLGTAAATTLTEVGLRVEGVPGQPKDQLTVLALNVILNKVNFINPTGGSTCIFKSLVLTDYFGDSVNAIEARAIFQRIPGISQSSGSSSPRGLSTLGSMIFDTFAQSITLADYNKLSAPNPGLGVFSSLDYLQCYLQEPCSFHTIPKYSENTGASGNVDTGTAPPKPPTTVKPVAPTYTVPEPDLANEHKIAMVTHAKVESKYLADRHIVALPYAKATIGAKDDSVSHVQLGNGAARRVVTLEVERMGQWPHYWDVKQFTDRSGIKHFPLKDEINLRPPELQADGNMLYVIDQVITFSLNRIPSNAEKSTASLPWDNVAAALLPGDKSWDPTGNKPL